MINHTLADLYKLMLSGKKSKQPPKDLYAEVYNPPKTSTPCTETQKFVDKYIGIYTKLNEDNKVAVYAEPNVSSEADLKQIGDITPVGIINAVDFKKIKHAITGKQKEGSEELLKKLIKAADLPNKTELYNTILGMFYNNLSDPQSFLYYLVEHKANIINLLDACKTDRIFKLNTLDFFEPLTDIMGENSETEINDLINDLYNFAPKLGMSVGRGEICLSLLTNASKGTSGDLHASGHEIEFKATEARPGGPGKEKNIGAKYAPSAANRLSKILEDNGININNILHKHEISIINTKRNKSILNLKENIKKLQIYIDQNELKLQPLQASNKQKKTIANIQKENDDLLNIINVYKEGDLIKLDKSLNNVLKKYSDPIRTEIKSILLADGDIERIKDKEQDNKNIKFNRIVPAFFLSDLGLSNEIIAKALTETRNYKTMNSYSTEELYNDVLDILNNNNDEYIKNETNLKLMIAAIHIACYQDVEGFDYILFANDKDLKVFPRSFNYSGNRIEHIINRMSQARWKITFNIDNTFTTGVQVTLLGA